MHGGEDSEREREQENGNKISKYWRFVLFLPVQGNILPVKSGIGASLTEHLTCDAIIYIYKYV